MQSFDERNKNALDRAVGLRSDGRDASRPIKSPPL